LVACGKNPTKKKKDIRVGIKGEMKSARNKRKRDN